MIESAVSSNRIEGVAVEPSRIRAILAAPRPLFRGRDEEEVRGYRGAIAEQNKERYYDTLEESSRGRLGSTRFRKVLVT